MSFILESEIREMNEKAGMGVESSAHDEVSFKAIYGVSQVRIFEDGSAIFHGTFSNERLQVIARITARLAREV